MGALVGAFGSGLAGGGPAILETADGVVGAGARQTARTTAKASIEGPCGSRGGARLACGAYRPGRSLWSCIPGGRP